MSKATSYFVSPTEFEEVFDFTPCDCHEYPSKAGSATYTVEYETESYSTMLKRITVTCRCCGKQVTKNVQSKRIDGDDIGF